MDLHRHLWDAGRAGELGARSGAGDVRERDWGGEVRDPEGAGDVRERDRGGELRDPDAAADVRERSGPGEARERHWGGELRDPDAAADVGERSGPGEARERDWGGEVRDPEGAAEVCDWTGAGEGYDRTGTKQTRDRARTSQIPDQLPDRTEAAEGHAQTGTSQTPDQTGTDELRQGSDVGEPSMRSWPSQLAGHEPELMVPPDCAVDRWAAEARILLAAEGRTGGLLLVRLGGRQRLVLELAADDDLIRPVPTPSAGTVSALPVLPDAATWVLPDLQLLRAGAIEAERLHPLVAAALAPDRAATGPPRTPDRPGRPRLVECRGARHRIGLVDGVLAPLDHDPVEIRREELLVALTGTPLPCLQAIDEAHRRPHCLAGVRERLVHGDTAGALAVVEGLLGPEALLSTGPLRDELEAAALRRITYGLFRAGLTGPGPTRFRPRPSGRDSRNRRTHPRHAT
nr:hypothetical protein [Streptomyces canus]